MRLTKLFPAFFVVCMTLPSVLPAFCPSANSGKAEKIMAQLSPPERRILDDVLKKAKTQNRKLRENKMKLEAELDELLAAPDFDKRTYLDKTAKLGTLRAKISANLDDAIALAATEFTQEERGVLMKLRRQWHTHGYHEETSGDDDKDDHPPASL